MVKQADENAFHAKWGKIKLVALVLTLLVVAIIGLVGGYA